MPAARVVILVLSLGALGCGGGKAATGGDSLSARQRDSVIGESQLPGAQGVRGALRVSDSADARRAKEEGVGE